MTILLILAAAVAGVALAIPLSIAATRKIRRDPKRSAGLIIAASLFTSFAFVGQPQADLIEEAKDGAKRKKDDLSLATRRTSS